MPKRNDDVAVLEVWKELQRAKIDCLLRSLSCDTMMVRAQSSDLRDCLARPFSRQASLADVLLRILSDSCATILTKSAKV